jgi:hypothetical protein
MMGGLVHDFFYQRYAWFALGLLVPLAVAKKRPALSEGEQHSPG